MQNGFGCVRCGQRLSVITSPQDYNTVTRRCGRCEAEVAKILAQFQKAFRKTCQDYIISDEEWVWLKQGLEKVNIPTAEIAAYIRADALYFMERSLAIASSDGDITEAEAERIRLVKHNLNVPDDLARGLLERLEQLLAISNIQRGHLPIVASPDVTLESDEICHLVTTARYHKVSKKSVDVLDGRLVATNRRLHFLSATGGWSIRWKSIMRVEGNTHRVYLEGTTNKGSGDYDVPDGKLVHAVLDTLTRIAKRQLLVPAEKSTLRHISHEVKTAVWQRDQGRCTECGAQSYLEYDHIIPIAKGGASSFENVRLLCRSCNSKKSGML